MVHLIPCKKSITAAETAKMFWDNIVKLHGIPAVLYSDRGTQFTSNFWRIIMGFNRDSAEILYCISPSNTRSGGENEFCSWTDAEMYYT